MEGGQGSRCSLIHNNVFRKKRLCFHVMYQSQFILFSVACFELNLWFKMPLSWVLTVAVTASSGTESSGRSVRLFCSCRTQNQSLSLSHSTDVLQFSSSSDGGRVTEWATEWASGGAFTHTPVLWPTFTLLATRDCLDCGVRFCREVILLQTQDMNEVLTHFTLICPGVWICKDTSGVEIMELGKKKNNKKN